MRTKDLLRASGMNRDRFYQYIALGHLPAKVMANRKTGDPRSWADWPDESPDYLRAFDRLRAAGLGLAACQRVVDAGLLEADRIASALEEFE